MANLLDDWVGTGLAISQSLGISAHGGVVTRISFLTSLEAYRRCVLHGSAPYAAAPQATTRTALFG